MQPQLVVTESYEHYQERKMANGLLTIGFIVIGTLIIFAMTSGVQ